MHVLLIGLRCSGKTTVGPLLAQRLGRLFVDLDDRTAAAAGCGRAGEALRSLGEPGFRAAEVRALREVLEAGVPMVVALGGGTPTAPGAAAMLMDAQARRAAVVVYLRASPEVLTERMRAGGHASRPSLTGAGAVDEVAVLFQRRDPLYMRLADRVVDATLPTAQIVEQVASPGE